MPSTRVKVSALTLLCAASVSACASDEQTPAPAPEPTARETSAAQASTTFTTATSSVESSTESFGSEPSSAASSSAASEEAEPSESASATLSKSVEEVYKVFSPIAPISLFEDFTSCDSVAQDSYNCSGPTVGQFQFVKSDSKATQSVQLLTQLRTSHVVKDSGTRVVGWSTLGTTAVLTVVDDAEGLVMQQMISTDEKDPEERLKELGLA